MKVVVVVVTYNGENWIEICLNSIFNSNISIVPIIVDNNSTDETISIISKKYPSVHLVKSKINLGFGKANNIGLQVALDQNADYVLLLNQDAWLEPDTLEKLIISMQQNQDYWIVSPIQKHSFTNGLELNFRENLKDSKVDFKDIIDEIIEIRFVNASIWLMSRQCIEIVGGFDPLFPHYGEDNDYAMRVRFWGGKLGVINAVGYHDKNSNSSINIQKEIYRTTLAIVGQLKNINYLLIFNLFIETKRLFQKSLKFCIKVDFITLQVYSISFFKSIMQLNKIRIHRDLSKVKGAFLRSR